jgi:hypothetical protein
LKGVYINVKGKAQVKNVKSGWECALEDAQQKHAQGRKYVSRMRALIRGIQRKIALGEEFPGEERRGNAKIS